MSKQEKHKLLFPPRDPRGDPRNKLRMKAGQALGRKMQGYDLPVRKVRKVKGSKMVTIPAEVCAATGIDFGDDIVFCRTDVPGVVWISAIKRPDDSAGSRRGG